MRSTMPCALSILLFTRAAWSIEPLAGKEIPADVIAVAKGGNEFATDLYGRLCSEKSSNLFFSPYSISAALTMTYAGAEGETKTQMAEVLHLPKPEPELHSSLNSLRKVLASNGDESGFQLRVASRLWGQNGFRFRPEFLRVTEANYGAQLGLLDFNQTESARKSINAWVEEQTDRKIQNLLVPGVLSTDTRLVLTNAIYFMARWKVEFNKSLTSDAPFHISETQQITVPTMHQTHHFNYAESEHAQVLELPYGQDSGLSMLVLLPKTKDGLRGLEKEMSSDNLHKWSTGLKLRNVNVHLPRFKMTSEFSLKDMLTSMGMSLAFAENADFSRITTRERLSISAVIHKAFVDVNEEGTEAAAATAIVSRALSLAPKPETPVEFHADHPFVFLIRHERTQSVLFLGRLVNPKGQSTK